MVNKQQGKKNRKLGRNKVKCAAYRGMRTREKNKLRRILRSSGVDEALRMAERYGMSGYLKSSPEYRKAVLVVRRQPRVRITIDFTAS